MKTDTMTKLTYEAPEASVDVIETEQCFLQGTVSPRQLQDMNWNGLVDDDDFDIDY